MYPLFVSDYCLGSFYPYNFYYNQFAILLPCAVLIELLLEGGSTELKGSQYLG